MNMIEDFQFAFDADIKEMVIPENTTSIGDYSFAYCENLERVIIPESVTVIGHSAFRECKSLKTINLSENTKLGFNVFGDCINLDKEATK